jgi:hypothetical protein
VLVAELQLRLLSFPLPGGGQTSVAGPTGTLVGALLAVRRGTGDLDPTIGVTSHLPHPQATSSRVGIDARTADLIAWSSHRALIPLRSTSDSRVYVSPVIARIEASSSARVRFVLGPRTILQQSFNPVNTQAILDRCCKGAIRCLRKSPSTIMDVRPPLARVLT